MLSIKSGSANLGNDICTGIGVRNASLPPAKSINQSRKAEFRNSILTVLRCRVGASDCHRCFSFKFHRIVVNRVK